VIHPLHSNEEIGGDICAVSGPLLRNKVEVQVCRVDRVSENRQVYLELLKQVRYALHTQKFSSTNYAWVL
jgi:hypothetical protein